MTIHVTSEVIEAIILADMEIKVIQSSLDLFTANIILATDDNSKFTTNNTNITTAHIFVTFQSRSTQLKTVRIVSRRPSFSVETNDLAAIILIGYSKFLIVRIALKFESMITDETRETNWHFMINSNKEGTINNASWLEVWRKRHIRVFFLSSFS